MLLKGVWTSEWLHLGQDRQHLGCQRASLIRKKGFQSATVSMCGHTHLTLRNWYICISSWIPHAMHKYSGGKCGVLGKLSKRVFKKKRLCDNSLVRDLHQSVKQRLNKLTSLLLLWKSDYNRKCSFKWSQHLGLLTEFARHEQISRKKQNDWPHTLIHQMTLMENDANDKAADDTPS